MLINEIIKSICNEGGYKALTSLCTESFLKQFLDEYTPNEVVNIFCFVPEEWFKDTSIKSDAIVTFNKLTGIHRQVFNAVLWDFDRLKRFVLGPSSIGHHHNDQNGNLIHTIEVMKQAALIGMNDKTLNYQCCLLTAFLHDVGKADEYKYDDLSGRYQRTARGKLLGHRLIGFGWFVEAITQWQIKIDTDLQLKVSNILTSSHQSELGSCSPNVGFGEFYAICASDQYSARNNFLSKQNKSLNRKLIRF